MVEPQSVIYLCRTPLENDYKNQLTFANATAQSNYFESTWVRSFGTGTGKGYTYVRKDNKIVLECKIDEVIGCNYLYYRNVGFSNKTYYCFITKMEYISEESTAVYVESDVFQTYMFDIHYHPCFIEREHVADDTIGIHTVPESVECGEYVMNDSPVAIAPNKLTKDQSNTTTITSEMIICFQVSKFITEYSFMHGGRYYNRIFSGLKFFGVQSVADANKIISGFDKAGKAENIVAIFMAPKEFFQNCEIRETVFQTEDSGGSNVSVYVLIPSETAYTTSLADKTTISMNSTINGYTPKNNKLFTYPYNYLYCTNNAGQDVIYHYEDFKNNSAKFMLNGVLGQGCSTKLVPLNYKKLELNQGDVENFPYGISGAKYPISAWASDYYTNWLTQNAVNMGVNVFNKTLSSGMVGAFSGNPAIMAGSAGVSLVTSVLGSLAEMDKAEKMPDQSHGNTNCSDVNFAWRKYFTINKMSVRYEYAQIIDNYFSMFGYKVNIVKTLQFNSRPNWNYVKTIGCNIDGQIPQEDVDTIRKMFDTGVTMWHNPSTMYDYTQNNNV